MDVLVIGGAATAAAGLIAALLLRRRRNVPVDTEEAGWPRSAPWSRSEMLSLLGVVVGATVGIAGFLIPGTSSGPEAADAVSPVALAALVRQGPFSEVLPSEFETTGLVDVNIGDASAAGRIDALELKAAHSEDIGFFAHLEVYPTGAAAIRRAEARIETIERIYDGNVVDGGPEAYCAYKTIRAPTAWECGGTSGLVYAEATVAPNANAYQHLATGTVSAMLSYADEKARVAAGP